MFDFEPQVEKLDDVPEKFRGLYAKSEDGKFVLDEDLSKKLDTSGLNSALEKERKAAKEHKRALDAWTKLGKAPEEIQARVAELEKAAAGSKEGAVNFEKLKADLERAHVEALKKKDDDLNRAHKTVHEYLVEKEAIRVITEAKGSARLLLPLIRDRVRVVEDDGKLVVRVVDGEGDPRGNGKGGFMEMVDLVSEYKKDPELARAFEPEGKAGSGTRPGAGNGGKPGNTESTNPLDLISRGLELQKR